MNYNDLINELLTEMNDGIKFLTKSFDNESNLCHDDLLNYCEGILDKTFSKFKNDDFEYLKPSIVFYKNRFNFIPVELYATASALNDIYNKLLNNKNEVMSMVKIKK